MQAVRLIAGVTAILLTARVYAHRGEIPQRPSPAPTPSRDLILTPPKPAPKPQPPTTPARKEPGYVPATANPPVVPREFRATWIPTVGNSCWPSKPGLPTATQKAELIALLDRAVALKLNAVIFQVRPAGDALYRSDIEPWSEYLTGIQGRAPSPYYDPLEFAVAEAHKRGLELHAWFNPYRARHKNAKSPVAANHVSRARPGLVRSYGDYLWMDPGERDVQDYSARVVLDVVRRYDVDGIHFDDYFYPYPEKNSAGQDRDFPDETSWRKSGAHSGLTRADWRRRNVDQFVQRIYAGIHAEKPWVKFGISPFGIWRPQNPPGIEGLDAYERLYADARKWLREGWCDYLAPQLYWNIEYAPTSFTTLLKWWNAQNPKQRHIWPGINSLKVGAGWPVGEITNQIALTRKLTAAPGQIHWSEAALMKNAGLGAALANSSYQQPALVPRYPWLTVTPSARPELRVTLNGNQATARWTATNAPALWLLQSKQYGDWKTQILPGSSNGYKFDLPPEVVVITAVDRNGNLSAACMMKLDK